GATGRATVTDRAEQSLLSRTQAEREIKFQQLRTEGLEVQRQAAEKFRTGQAEEALNFLVDYLARLENVPLDPGQLTLLKRPVEARLKNFELLKEQKEFAERTNASRVDHNKKHNLRVEYEENKRKNVSQLMKEFDNLYKEGKYVEAESMAVRAKELDPDNSVVTAAVHIAKMKSRQNDY